MLNDNYNRYFSYLRLSITDVCNFNCKYCLPSNFKMKKKENLSVLEIYNLVLFLSKIGIKKVRITGGEPTVRKDFCLIGKKISSIKSIKKLVFTTNAYNLFKIIDDIVESGFSGINISLDTLNFSKFNFITGRDYFLKVLKGIFKSLNKGLNIKLNIVLSDFFTFSDFEDFYFLLKYKNIKIRFIDQMETNLISKKKNVIKSDFLINFLIKNGWIFEKKYNLSDGPSLNLYHNNFLGKIGFINPYSSNFCLTCNRLRVSSDGNLFLCLFGGKSYNIRKFLKNSSNEKYFINFLNEKLKNKKKSHFLSYKNFGIIKSLSSIGG